MANELTTIQISKAHSAMLKVLSKNYKRSKSSHAEWLIEQDYAKLVDMKMVGKKAATKPETIKA